MKQLLFLLTIILLASCGGAGVQPTDNITWGTAFNHVSQSFSYWLWVFLALIAAAAYVWAITKSKDGWTHGRVLILFVALALLMASIMYLPSEIAVNTTVEQAARGVFIGY